jgi:glycine oxidase
MEASGDVLIVGGGVIGLTTAWFLARAGARVTLVDKGDLAQESSWAGAGILPADSLAHARTPLEQLRAHSVALFPALSAELRELTGIDNGYCRCGGLEFLRPLGEAAAEEWHAEGMKLERLEPPALAQLEPALAPGLGAALLLPDMGQLRNPRHLQALQVACAQRGVRFRPGCPVLDFARTGQRIVAVETPAGRLAADRFLLTAGAWSDPLLDKLGWRPGIQPVRGQMVLLRCEAPPVRRVLLWGSRYLVPRLDGRVLVGSTEEHAGFDKRTTAQAVADLIGLAVQLVPALGEAPVERCWAGLRPGSPDGLPYLGPVPGWDNVFVAAGHFRAGIQLSPATALVMKECLLNEPLTVPLEAFRLDR